MKCGCCDFPLGKKKSAAKVSPGTVCHVDYDVLEARPNRFIRVRHENIRTRTEKQDPATIDIEVRIGAFKNSENYKRSALKAIKRK